MKIRARERYILIGADYSQQEPKLLAVFCQDAEMLRAANEGQDLYATVAARAFHTTYEDCLEHFPANTPIIQEDGAWRYATDEEIKNNRFDKLADGVTDTYKAGKNRRKQAKTILLGMMYGRGHKALAEQLGCDIEEAKAIMQSVYNAFPKVKQFEIDRKKFAKQYYYVTTLWGRKRRLPDFKLDAYDINFDNCKEPFKSQLDWQKDRKAEWQAWFKAHEWEIDEKNKKRDELEEKYGVNVTFNSVRISDAERQVINSCIQGSAADMSKKAIVAIANNQELKDLGFQMLVPIHDEILAQCPLANAQRCKELFMYEMENCAKDKVPLDIKTDPTCSFVWYGEEIDLDNIGETPINKVDVNEKVELTLEDTIINEDEDELEEEVEE